MKSHLTRRQFVCGGTAVVAAGLVIPQRSAAEDSTGAWLLENQYVKFAVGADARPLHFVDKQTGRDYCNGNSQAAIAHVRKAGRQYDATSAQVRDGHLVLAFGDADIQAVLKGTARSQHLVLEVISVAGEGVEELTLVDIPLTLHVAPSGTSHHWEVTVIDGQRVKQDPPQEPFAACTLALNLRTNVEEIPQPASRLRAMCYSRFGMVGAKVALVAAPQEKLRAALQEAVGAAEDLPHSPLGGPWALDQPINRGSYVFNFGGMTIEKADDWIKQATSLGVNQIDFHGGNSFRFGDCRPNPETYPDGVQSFKAVIDKLHAAGIAAGLHTYAFFIDKKCPWVTPVPDPRLASDAMLTLSADIAADAVVVPVVESTASISAITGFFVRNSVTLRVDEELIVYSGATKEPPFVFTGCTRGAYGTHPSSHAKDAKVHHLKECFGLFAPDPETTLFEEVAARTAEMFNACGFDMIYLDALDGEDVLGGVEYGWHYGSRFVYEIWKRLKKPALMEMSTFHHHLWCVRSRHCAWDYPRRAHKKFIDLHCAMNEEVRRMYLPGELGWWAIRNWSGPEAELMASDDIEYLMGKCLGTDTGCAFISTPDGQASGANAQRLGAIIRRYEELRHSGKVPESIKAQLCVPGEEFTLIGSLQEGWEFRPAQYAKHKVESVESWSSQWKATNKFAAQPLRVRIEALMAAGPYDASDNPIVTEFTSPDDFPNRASAPSITAALASSKDVVKSGAISGCLTATNGSQSRAGSWAKLEKAFAPTRDLKSYQALGVWVYGDQQGELINLQLRSPQHLAGGAWDHYIVVDFAGWRYFELIEPEGDRYTDYQWPYGDIYSIYREPIDFKQVETLGLWYNHLPLGKPVRCYLSPIKALPLVPAKLVNPIVSLGGQSITFPVEIPTGHYLECLSPGECVLYGPNGERVRKVEPQGAIPMLQPGQNEVRFQAQTLPGLSARANVTLITQGEAIR